MMSSPLRVSAMMYVSWTCHSDGRAGAPGSGAAVALAAAAAPPPSPPSPDPSAPTGAGTKKASCPARCCPVRPPSAARGDAGSGPRPAWTGRGVRSCGSGGRASSVAALSSVASAARTAASTAASTASRSRKRTSALVGCTFTSTPPGGTSR